MSHCQHSESQIGTVGVPSHVWLLATLWTVTNQAPLSMRFPGKEYWSVLPFPSSGHLPDAGIKPTSPAWQVDSLPSSPGGKTTGVISLAEHLAAGSPDFQGGT